MRSAFKGKSVLITGGLGFLGSNLAEALVGQGADVALVDNFLPAHGGNVFNLNGFEKRVRWVEGDIRDATLMAKLVRGRDYLFNIAAQTSHTDSMKDPLLDADINARGQITLLEAVRRENPRLRVVYCSTRAVYGSAPGKKKIGEGTLPRPLDVYSVHKLAGEHYHRIYGNVHGLNATILRLANVYGPRAQMKQPSFGILNWFIRLAIDGQPIRIFGEGLQVRDYMYVRDAVRAFLAVALKPGLAGRTYNLASGKGLPLIQIVREVVRLAGKGSIVHVPWPQENRKIDVGDFVADVRRVRRDAGWRAEVPLAEGLRETIAFYEAHKRHYW